MKRISPGLLAAISTVSLVIVLLFQVNWILRNARIRGELFNEKAGMVLARTAESIRQDSETCQRIEACAGDLVTSGSVLKLGEDEVRTIDSLLRNYMKLYNLQVGYTFEVAAPGRLSSLVERTDAGSVYNKPLERMTGGNEIELKLTLPGKKQFILAELGPLFITSVILILLVILISWQTLRSLRREQRISEQTTDFFNNMTHEFKTPVTNIALAGRMMMREGVTADPEKVGHYASIIREENEKLRWQVERVLSMTAIEKGEIPLEPVEIDMHELLGSVVRAMILQVESRNGKIVMHPDATLYRVMGDRAHLTSAMTNLVDNAVKYSREAPEIAISTAVNDRYLVISVADRGIGIGKEYLGMVFDKYFRVPTGDVHDVKGYGLGLAYTKKILELHGGMIGLQSEPGRGSTFTCKLPYV